MQIAQLVPRFLPAVCGVGDYARVLGDTLAQNHDIQSRYLVVSPQWRKDPTLPYDTRPLSAENPDAALLDATRDCGALVVQYSGYGYHKRNTPVWLVRALTRLRRLRPDLIIHVMFHELTTRGGLSSSSFWNWPIQRWVIQRLCALSNTRLFTNTEPYVKDLTRWSDRPVDLWPVYSNLEEPLPTQLPAWEQRRNTLAFFSWDMPRHFRQTIPGILRDAVRKLQVESVTVFRHPLPPDCDLPVPVIKHGVLPSTQVSSLLADCRYVLSVAPTHCPGKSGLLGAYAAHQIAVLLPGGSGDLPDGLTIDHNLFSLETLRERPSDQVSQELARQLQLWYQPHNRARTAQAFADVLTPR